MFLYLEDEELQDAELMSALEDELKEAEKICKAYGYDAEFFIDYKHTSVRGDIYTKGKYNPRIYIEDDYDFDIEIQTTSYGSLSWSDEYCEFLNACKNAMNLAERLYSNFVICRQLVKD